MPRTRVGVVHVQRSPPFLLRVVLLAVYWDHARDPEPVPHSVPPVPMRSGWGRGPPRYFLPLVESRRGPQRSFLPVALFPLPFLVRPAPFSALTPLALDPHIFRPRPVAIARWEPVPLPRSFGDSFRGSIVPPAPFLPTSRSPSPSPRGYPSHVLDTPVLVPSVAVLVAPPPIVRGVPGLLVPMSLASPRSSWISPACLGPRGLWGSVPPRVLGFS